MVAPNLVSLLKQYRSLLPDCEDKQSLKTQIIGYLSSCHWWKNPDIIALFPEETQEIKANLEREIEERLLIYSDGRYELQDVAELLPKEAKELRTRSQKKLITDRFINTLAIQVQKTEANTLERRTATQLLVQAMNVKDAYRKQGLGTDLQLSPQDWKEAYKDAKNDAIMQILKRIDTYDSSQNIMAWVNYLIPLKFSDAAVKIIGLKKSQFSKPKDERISINPVDSESIARFIESNAEGAERDRRSQEILKLIEEDPKNILGKVMKKRPDISFKQILIDRYFEDETWESLSQKWNVKKSSLSSFFERELKRVAVDLAEYLK